jgi:hypothetical protein
MCVLNIEEIKKKKLGNIYSTPPECCFIFHQKKIFKYEAIPHEVESRLIIKIPNEFRVNPKIKRLRCLTMHDLI